MSSVSSAFRPLAAVFIPRKRDERRSPDRLRAHYLVERELADRVRNAPTWEERRALFGTMYDELFRLVPDHPRLAAHRADSEERDRHIQWNLAQLAPYLKPGIAFLEIGAGDCALSARIARDAKQVYAVDISDQTQGTLPANAKLVISDGRSVDVPAGSIDVAFSDQLMEHLHPDDAIEQLRNIHRALKPGGVYMCVTPNRVYGPSDISAFFDDEPRGFHLKEYTLREIRAIFRQAGFPKTHVYVGARGYFMRCPAWVVGLVESTLMALPAAARRRLSDTKVARALLGLRVAAIKG
ncbi:MAG TPA: class I SAM-dependent methyltransferase [Usitatibacter sp.]|nr:class I SAM-dependent methyltransferase [Usitatibacter sp.]